MADYKKKYIKYKKKYLDLKKKVVFGMIIFQLEIEL